MCSDIPPPDPRIGEAAGSNAATAQQMADLAKEQFEFQTAEWERFRPMYEQIIQDNIADAATNRQRSTEAWDVYKNTFQPIEKRFAEEAMNYDSPAEVARREGLAAGTVKTQIDVARQDAIREAARMGVSAERAGLSQVANSNTAGLAVAGAVNKERNDTKLLGMQLRQDAANFGRGQTQTGLAAGAAALGNQNQQMNAAGNQTGMRQAIVGQYQGGLAGSISGNNSAANIYQNQYNQQVQGTMANNQATGSAIGTIASIAAYAISDEKSKKNASPTDEDAAMDGLRKIPVKDWDYKEGVADGGHHTGPMAQDVNKQFGDKTAPGGKMIDLISMTGKTLAAVKQIDKRVQRVERSVGLEPV